MGVWVEKTSTLPLDPSGSNTPLVTRPRGFAVSYGFFQTFGGEMPHTSADARSCAAHHANYGDSGIGVPWTGSCPALGAGTADQDWPTFNSFFSTAIASSWDDSLPFIPASYTVQTTKSGMHLSVDTTATTFSDLIVADVGASRLDQIEYETESVTANLSITPNLAGTSGTTDWTGILRSPAAGPDLQAHFITPAQLGSYPQIGSVAPGGSAAIAKPLTQYAPQPTFFQHDIYVSTDLGEMESVDLGLTTSRAGQWKVLASSLTATFRYRFKGAPPLHQRQRAAGGVDGHVSFARARSTRQSSILARGML